MSTDHAFADLTLGFLGKVDRGCRFALRLGGWAAARSASLGPLFFAAPRALACLMGFGSGGAFLERRLGLASGICSSGALFWFLFLVVCLCFP